MNYIKIILSNVFFISTIIPAQSVFRPLNKGQQAILFECIPVLVSIAIPLVKRKPVKMGLATALTSYSWCVLDRWGQYNRSTPSAMCKRVLVGLTIGYIIDGIKRTHKDDEQKIVSAANS